MVKKLKLEKKLSVLYFSPSNDYNFCLTGENSNGEAVEYFVTWRGNNTFTVHETLNGNYNHLKDISENHELICSFKETIGFKETMDEIEQYEEKMKNRLKIKNPAVEGKIDDNTYVLSFQLENSVLKKERVDLMPSIDETTGFEVLDPKTFLYIAVQREGASFIPVKEIKCKDISNGTSNRPNVYLKEFRHWTQWKKMHHTHRSFMNDLAEILLKEPRIRVKLLVN